MRAGVGGLRVGGLRELGREVAAIVGRWAWESLIHRLGLLFVCVEENFRDKIIALC